MFTHTYTVYIIHPLHIYDTSKHTHTLYNEYYLYTYLLIDGEEDEEFKIKMITPHGSNSEIAQRIRRLNYSTAMKTIPLMVLIIIYIVYV